MSVAQRLKKFPTILDKLSKYPTMRLTEMEDIGGVRAVLPTQEAADEVSRRLRKNWKVHRYRDYVRRPKASGYRALHLIVIKQGVKLEVQIRTFLQDYWANQVEHDSRQLRVDYKSGKGQDAVHAYYVAMSELMAMREEFDDYAAALAAYENIEKEHLGHNDLDIVLLGADSLETIKKTHSSYFETTKHGFERLFGDVLTAA